MRKFLVSTLLLVSFATAGCIPFPYLSSKAGLDPTMSMGTMSATPLWTRPAFRPADWWNLLFSASWPAGDRAPGIPPVLCAAVGGTELLAPLPDGLEALDPSTGAPRPGGPIGESTRRTRVRVAQDFAAVDPPLRVRGYGHGDNGWAPIPNVPSLRSFVPLTSGVVTLSGDEFALYLPNGHKAWGLVKTRGFLAGAAELGDLVLAGFLDPETGYASNAYDRTSGKFLWSVAGRLIGAREEKIIVARKDAIVRLLDSTGQTVESLEVQDALEQWPPIDVPPDFDRDGPRAKGWLAYGTRSQSYRESHGYDRLTGRSYGLGRSWQYQLSEPSYLAPVESGGMIFVTLGPSFSGAADLGGAYGALEAHDSHDGTVLFRLDFPAGFLSFCADRSHLYVWTRDGSLRAYRLEPHRGPTGQ